MQFHRTVANAHRHAHGDGNTNINTNADRDTHADGTAVPRWWLDDWFNLGLVDSLRYGNPNSDGDEYTNADSNSYDDADPYTNPNADEYAYIDIHSNRDADSNGVAVPSRRVDGGLDMGLVDSLHNGDTNQYGDQYPNGDEYADKHADPNQHADVHVYKHTDADADLSV